MARTPQITNTAHRRNHSILRGQKMGLVFETPADIEIREDEEREQQEWLWANYSHVIADEMDDDLPEFFEAFSEEMYSDPMEWEWEI